MLRIGHVAYAWATAAWLESHGHAKDIDYRAAAIAALLPTDILDRLKIARGEPADRDADLDLLHAPGAPRGADPAGRAAPDLVVLDLREAQGGQRERSGHIVAVPDVDHVTIPDRAEFGLDGEYIGDGLEGVPGVGQKVDDRRGIDIQA